MECCFRAYKTILEDLVRATGQSCTCNDISLITATQLLLLQACCPPAQVSRLRSELASQQLAEAVGGGVPPLHTPTRQLLFWDFCEALVRIAHLKFRHLPSLQQRLHQLLHTLILPHAIKVGLWYYLLGMQQLHTPLGSQYSIRPAHC